MSIQTSNNSEQAREVFRSSIGVESDESKNVVVPTEQIVGSETNVSDSTEVEQDVVSEIENNGTSDSVNHPEEQPNGNVEEHFATIGNLESFDAEDNEGEGDTVTGEENNIEITDKVKYNLSDYVNQYESDLSKYFKLKNLDVDSMKDEDLVRYKLRKEHPNWTSEDIEDELSHTYGVGLKLKEINYEDLTDDEISKLESYNENIERNIKRGNRLLKSESAGIKDDLIKEKESLQLPEVELDVTLGTNPKDIVERFVQEEQEKNNKYIEEVWKPSINEAVSKVGGFRQSVKIQVSSDVEVDQELTYKLTEKEKQRLTEYMVSYVGHPEDEKFINKETEEVDYKGLVSQKAKELFVDSIIQAGIREGIARFKEEYIKNHQINYSDDPVKKRISTSSSDSITERFNKRAQQVNPHQFKQF